MLNFVAKAAITVALTAANYALTATKKIQGPRLDDLKFSSGDYGATLPMVWGLRRLNVPIFWAEDLKEVKQRRKTKGGKYNDYTYYGTWAVALAGHEIAGVRRIWFDTHLVYDLSGAGPVTAFDFGDVSGTFEDFVSIYLGTDTQEQDPRILATTEAKNGEGSCPAYRDTAYIVFKDIPLEKLGNRIPQVAVEVVTNPANTIPTETHDAPQITADWGSAKFSSDYTRLLLINGENYEIWDTAARQPILWGTLGYSVGGVIGLYNDGRVLAIGNIGTSLYSFDADGGGGTEIASFTPSFIRGQTGVFVIQDGAGTEHWMTTSGNDYHSVDGTETNIGEAVSWYFADSYGDIWGVFRTSSTSVTIRRVIDGGSGAGWPDAITITGLPSGASDWLAVHSTDADGGDIFVLHANGTDNYIVDPATGTVLSHVAGVTVEAGVEKAEWANMVPGASTAWFLGSEISLATGEILRTPIPFSTLTNTIYDPINHAIIAQSDTNEIWHFLDRLSDDGIPLLQIASDLADMVGIEDYDFSDLDQTVTGWSATQGPASQILEPLLDTYDCDLRPHDFSIEGLKRTGVTSGTLATAYFVGNPRYIVTVRQAAELPRSVTINFADTAADQQPNNARADRPLDATGARGEQSLDMSTLALSVDDARHLGDRYFRRLWNERREASLSLTAQELKLEPGDVRTLTLDDESMTARLKRFTVQADGIIATEWVYDAPSLALLSGAAGADFDGRDETGVVVPLISKGFVLDIPLLTDADNRVNPLIYIAAAPYAEGTWPGAVIYEATGGEYTDETGSVPSSSRATWGYSTDVLADANPNLWDRGNSVNVSLQVGSLTGCTEADIDANPQLNLAILGNEILNFTTATLEGDGTYTLSGLKRGRRGTEWATGDHAARDVFLLLDTAESEELGLSDVGDSLSFKAITNGRTESGAFPIDLTFTGASLKPYAPCSLNAVKDPSTGDWTLTWTRRTRVGGAWTSGSTIPLGEDSEEYHVTVGDGVSDDTKTVTTASYVWDVATQTTDTGAEVMEGDLVWSIAQVSASVGDGFLAEATA